MGLILKTKDLAKVKNLSRQVSNFKERIWFGKRYKCCYQVVFNKFSQSPELKKLLLSTGDKYLVESANYDPIFGINLWQYKQGSLKGRIIDDVTFDVHPHN